MAKTRALIAIERWGFPYELRTFEATEFTAEEAAAALELDPSMLLKTLVVKGDRKGYVLAVIPSDHHLSLRKLAAVMGDKRVDLVPLEDLTRLTGYVKGGVSPLGTKKPMPVYLDRRAFNHAKVSVSAGQRGVQMIVEPAYLARATAATIDDLSDDEE